MDRPTEPPSRVESPTDDITLVLPAESTARDAIREPATEAAPPTPPPRRSRVWIVALVAALVIAGAVAAIALVLTRGGGDGETVAVTTEPSPSPSPAVLAPTSLTAEAGAFSVELRWMQPPGGTEIRGFNVYRDGIFTGFVTQDNRAFTDEEVAPGKDYTYEVAALVGGIASERVSVTVTTEIPPLKAARVQGPFDVVLRLASSYGYENIRSRVNFGWRFRPKCGEGACDVVWMDMFFKELRTVLDRKGARYTGSDSGKFNTRCGSATTTSTVTIEFKVVKAKAVARAWRATKLVGTFKHTEAPQFGCVSSGATYSFTARL